MKAVKIGDIATVNVESDSLFNLGSGRLVTGRVYHVRANGWPCVETPSGRCASGPCVTTARETLEGIRDFFRGADETRPD
jgi:hypothetical protein